MRRADVNGDSKRLRSSWASAVSRAYDDLRYLQMDMFFCRRVLSCWCLWQLGWPEFYGQKSDGRWEVSCYCYSQEEEKQFEMGLHVKEAPFWCCHYRHCFSLDEFLAGSISFLYLSWTGMWQAESFLVSSLVKKWSSAGLLKKSDTRYFLRGGLTKLLWVVMILAKWVSSNSVIFYSLLGACVWCMQQ